MLVTMILAAGLQQGPSPELRPFDSSALTTLVAAREEALAVRGWKLRIYWVDADGQRIDGEGRPREAPISVHRLWYDGARKKLHSLDYWKDVEVTALVVDGELSVLTEPLARGQADVAGRRHSFRRGGDPRSEFSTAYFPDSFGLGFAGFPLSSWLSGEHGEEAQVLECGEETVLGRRCLKLLLITETREDGTRDPQAMLWVDAGETLLVLRAHALTERSLAPPAGGYDQTVHLDGREYVVTMRWEVLDLCQRSGFYLPRRGRFRNERPGVPGYNIEIEPLLPAGGWPADTFELEPPQGWLLVTGGTSDGGWQSLAGLISVAALVAVRRRRAAASLNAAT